MTETFNIAEQLVSMAVPIDTLNEDPANARLHNDRNMRAIKASLARFGQRAPIVVNKNGMIVEAGNGRLAAARALGWTHIAAVLVDDDAVTAASFAIADNRTAELAEWNHDALASVLATLAEASDEPLSDLGWSDEDLDTFTAAFVAEVAEAPEAPDDVDIFVKRGDVWSLGRHTIVCADSSTVEYPKDFGVVVWDPPWNLELEFYPNLNKAPSVLAMCDGHRLSGIVTLIEHLPLAWSFVWDCVSSWYTPNRPLRRHKQCLWFGDVTTYDFDGAHYGDTGSPRQVSNTRGTYNHTPDPRGKHLSDLFSAPITREHANGHKHGKPIDWMRLLIGNTSSGTVVDPFLGGGSTLFAAEQLNRACFGVELDPETCSAVVRRWENMTSKNAVRIQNGQA